MTTKTGKKTADKINTNSDKDYYIFTGTNEVLASGELEI